LVTNGITIIYFRNLFKEKLFVQNSCELLFFGSFKTFFKNKFIAILELFINEVIS
jgi:hypothetical protein